MIKTLALAGAAAALVLGGIAVAQTQAPNDQSTGMNAQNAQQPNASQPASPSDQGTAQSADQNGAPASATAGERG